MTGVLQWLCKGSGVLVSLLTFRNNSTVTRICVQSLETCPGYQETGWERMSVPSGGECPLVISDCLGYSSRVCSGLRQCDLETEPRILSLEPVAVGRRLC